MSQPDKNLLTASEKYLNAAIRDYSAGDYSRFGESIASAAEMLGKYFLEFYNVCKANAVYNTYKHSIRGIFTDLEKHLTAEVADDVIFCVQNIAAPSEESRTAKELDRGFNGYRYSYKSHRSNAWPHEWVDEDIAKPIFLKSYPVLRNLLNLASQENADI